MNTKVEFMMGVQAMYSINNPPSILPLGNQGEMNAREITFDVSPWLAEHPGALIGITYLRPLESGTPHPAADVSTIDGITRWLVGAHALEVAGSGTVVVRCMQGEVEVRSAIMYSTVAAGHAPAGPVPEAMEDYVADILQAGQGAKADAVRAEQAAVEAADTLQATEVARNQAKEQADRAEGEVDRAVSAAEAAEYDRLATSSTYNQFQQDLGVHVATLINGKHDPEQVNYAVIGEQHIRDTKAELDALLSSGRADKEDIGYVLTGYNVDGDPLYDRYTVIGGVWVKSASNATYSEQSAYALQAGGAANSNRVNGIPYFPIRDSDFEIGHNNDTLPAGVYVIFDDDEVLPTWP